MTEKPTARRRSTDSTARRRKPGGSTPRGASSPPKPDRVWLIELAIAAGLAGKPVCVAFPESAADVDVELWKHFSKWVGNHKVLHVRNTFDVRSLNQDVELWRFIVLHSPRLLDEVAWTMQLHWSKTTRRPAVFCWNVPDTLDDAPLPSLIARGTGHGDLSIVSWLVAGGPGQSRLREDFLAYGEVNLPGVEFDPRLVPATMPRRLPAGRGPDRLRECQVLQALLAGAALLDWEGKPTACKRAGGHPPRCGKAEYERVRTLLQSPLLTTCPNSVPQLAIDMINRTNVLLEYKSLSDMEITPPLLRDDDDLMWLQLELQTGRELTNRREVTDLGNLESDLIRRLLQLLIKFEAGYAQFQRMGLLQPPPTEEEFRAARPATLAPLLRRWSYKQVEKQFYRLQQAGLISYERDSPNRPWQYRLPEELHQRSTPFSCLPTADSLCVEQNTKQKSGNQRSRNAE